MNEQYPSIKLFGLNFNLTNDIGVLVSAILVFLLVFWLSRNLQMRPGAKAKHLGMDYEFYERHCEGCNSRFTTVHF